MNGLEIIFKSTIFIFNWMIFSYFLSKYNQINLILLKKINTKLFMLVPILLILKKQKKDEKNIKNKVR